jgi:hypothetical protein
MFEPAHTVFSDSQCVAHWPRSSSKRDTQSNGFSARGGRAAAGTAVKHTAGTALYVVHVADPMIIMWCANSV